MIKLVFCDDYNGTINIDNFVERGVPPDITLKQIGIEVE